MRAISGVLSQAAIASGASAGRRFAVDALLELGLRRERRRELPGGARGRAAVHDLAQAAVLGVLHDRQVGGDVQQELPPGQTVLLRRSARGLEHVLGNARERRALLDVYCERIGGVERVLGELRRELRRFVLDLGVALLPVGRELRPRKPEVADLVVDDLRLRAREPRELRSGAQRLVLLEECEVVAERGPVLDDLRLVLLVRLAQLRRVEHRVQVPDHAPGAPEPLVRVLERLRELGPRGRRLGPRELVDQRPVVGEQLVDRGRDVLRLHRGEARQAREIEKRVRVHLHRDLLVCGVHAPRERDDARVGLGDLRVGHC